MKWLIGLLFVIVLFGGFLGACSQTSKRPASLISSTISTTRAKEWTRNERTIVRISADADKDDDIEASSDDTNHNYVLGNAGSPANVSDSRAITALVKRYYATALTEDGHLACSMIDSPLATAIPEDYGRSPPGEPYMRGTTCSGIVTDVFRHFHYQLRLEVPQLTIADIRVKRGSGLVVLHFGSLPERRLLVHRERGHWRLGSILDGELP
jgi:hypothetical protein